MISRLLELREKILSADEQDFPKVVEDVLKEIYYDGYSAGWIACGKRIIKEVENIR